MEILVMPARSAASALIAIGLAAGWPAYSQPAETLTLSRALALALESNRRAVRIGCPDPDAHRDR